MRRLHFDCGMGAAGDMLTGALCELMPSREEAVEMLNGMGIPGILFEAEDSVKCGVAGTHIRVTYNGIEEMCYDAETEAGSAAEAEAMAAASGGELGGHVLEGGHDEHHHEHHHHSLADIEEIIYGLNVSEPVKEDIIGIYEIIADAESLAHGVTVTEVHFHEVGSMDAVADTAACCLLMSMICPDAVSVSDIHVGSGTVFCAHGELPVPTPAAANILAGLPTYGGEIRGELCTPTGAAVLKYFGTEFGRDTEEWLGRADEAGAVVRTGRGMGRKDFPRPNCVTAYLSEE